MVINVIMPLRGIQETGDRITSLERVSQCWERGLVLLKTLREGERVCIFTSSTAERSPLPRKDRVESEEWRVEIKQ